MPVYYFILTCMAGPCMGLPPIVSKDSQYSLQTCKSDARAIARGMFVIDGSQYAFTCKPVAYEPMDLTPKGTGK